MSRQGESYVFKGTFMKYIESLAPYFEELIICSPETRKKEASFTEPLRATNISHCPLPYATTGDFLKGLPFSLIRSTRLIWQGLDRWDIVLVRVPYMFGIVIFLLARWRGVPAFLYITSDMASVQRLRAGRSWWRRLIFGGMALVNDLFLRWASRRHLCFILSNALYHRYSKRGLHVYPALTSLVSEKDIVNRWDTCQGSPIHILYAGYLTGEKGLPILLEAFEELLKRHPVALTLAGDGPLRPELEELVKRRGLADHVTFTGFLPYQELINQLFDRADIFVLPSLSEGVPKVIFEAKARGLPIVATRVGGVPDFISDEINGLLVPPGSSPALCQAMERIITNGELRRRIIKGAVESVRNETMEVCRNRLLNTLNKHFGLNIPLEPNPEERAKGPP
jgi:glycosyltransferase involved in cell wall biosynthesis